MVEAALSAGDVDFDATEPPGSWVAELGEAEAKRRFRIALDARRSSKEKPAYLDMALRSYVAIAKARASRGDTTIAPLAANIYVAVQQNNYAVKDVTPDPGAEKGRKR